MTGQVRSIMFSIVGTSGSQSFTRPSFIRVLAEGLQKYSVELFSFTLMPNHWHLVLRPVKDGQMGRFIAGTSQKNPTPKLSHPGRSDGLPDGTSASMPPKPPANWKPCERALIVPGRMEVCSGQKRSPNVTSFGIRCVRVAAEVQK